jgi:hypothetical protein
VICAFIASVAGRFPIVAVCRPGQLLVADFTYAPLAGGGSPTSRS